MDNKMAVFNNREFGSIRVIEQNGKYLFCGFDVAKALGYAKPRNAINTHCKGALKRGALTEGGVQELTFIPEGDVYRLIVHSRMPGAERFEKWVFDEVLPMIRKTGGYMTASLLEQAAEKPEILLAFADQLLAEHEFLFLGGHIELHLDISFSVCHRGISPLFVSGFGMFPTSIFRV